MFCAIGAYVVYCYLDDSWSRYARLALDWEARAAECLGRILRAQAALHELEDTSAPGTERLLELFMRHDREAQARCLAIANVWWAMIPARLQKHYKRKCE